MDRWLSRAATAALLGIMLLLIGANAVAAAEAGVVVRHGDGGFTYAIVVFPEGEISSFELLGRTGLSLSTVEFGGLGQAVCTLDGEGCGIGDCRQRLCQSGDPDSPFWQFFRQGEGGAWVAQPLGASASRVVDGDIDVWSWTGSEANVPALDLQAIAGLLGVDEDDLLNQEARVYTASFDASGNRVDRTVADDSDATTVVLGLGALVLLAAVAVLIARRRRGLLVSGE